MNSSLNMYGELFLTMVLAAVCAMVLGFSLPVSIIIGFVVAVVFEFAFNGKRHRPKKTE